MDCRFCGNTYNSRQTPTCPQCQRTRETQQPDSDKAIKDAQQRARRNAARRARHQAYTDLGMVRVRGALGGTYYE